MRARSTSRHGIVAAGIAAAAALFAAGAPAVADELLYYVDDGRVVITNVPSRADVRTVPGFEERVVRALRGTLPATPWDGTIEIVARRHGLSPDLIKAVAMVESGFDPRAVSPKGAKGLMQLMPATAEAYGVEDPFDPNASLDAGARLLRDLLDQFGGDLSLALAGYNAGAGAVRRWGGVPDYRETRDYVRKVRSRLGSERRAPSRTTREKDGDDIRVRTLSDGTVMLSN